MRPLISTVHITEPPAAPSLIWVHTVMNLPCLPFSLCLSLCVCVSKPRANKSKAFIAAVPRAGIDDGRAPLTHGVEEAAVTLYPVNSEYIVLKRGC